MTPQEFDELLLETLEDNRLSRAERKVLRQILGDLDLAPRQLAAFRQRAFSAAQSALKPSNAKLIIDWLEDVTKALTPPAEAVAVTPAEAYFSPGKRCRQRIVSLFQNARRTADVCVFTITDDNISEAILAAHRRGVDVRVLTDNDKSEDRGSDVARLRKAGIPVRVDQTQHHMHHKFAVFDRSQLLTGSYNWTRSAARSNWENVVVLHEARIVGRFMETFEALWVDLSAEG